VITEPAVADAPGQDADDLITTADQLRAYLDSHPTRHAPAEAGGCVCGWPHVPPELLGAVRTNNTFPAQAEHAEAVLIGALGDLLPSDTSAQNDSGAMAPLPWRPLVRRLYDEIDYRDRSLDPRFVTLMRWCIDQGHADVITLAQITTSHPNFLAKLLNVPAPDAKPETKYAEHETPDNTP